MRVRVYNYNDISGFSTPRSKVKSNLCTWYYTDKQKFCGNYCSRSGRHGDKFNRRCWRHKRRGAYSSTLPPVVLLMISASERTYNRDLWIRFLQKCEVKGVPFELVIYHEDMTNCTVRNPQNLLSRFRPFPDIFGNVIPLRNSHGSLNFAQVYLKMLEYGVKIPHAARCIVITERTIPIRPPVDMYKRAMASQCYVDISYNVQYGPIPPGVKGARGKPFAGVNNLCQGIYTTEFLKVALTTVPQQCEKFGISYNRGRYEITNKSLCNMWSTFTGGNLNEFWLLNSFLLNVNSDRPISTLKEYMDDTVENDKYVIAEIPELRGNWKRTYVYRDTTTREVISKYDVRAERYYRGLDFATGVSLLEVVRYIRSHKSRALFFRQVELP